MSEDSSVSLIFDTGSFQCRAGFATDDYPRIVYPTIYGYPKAEIEHNPALNYYGKNAMQHSASLSLNEIFPGTREPVNWDIYEAFLQNVIQDELQLEQIERPVLSNYYANNGREIREKECKIFFETFGAHSYFAVSSSLLSLYSSGRLNGVILESGHSRTSVTPIIDGLPLLYAAEYVSFGGKPITEYIHNALGLPTEAARQMKERFCTSSIDFDKETLEFMPAKFNEELTSVTLPDGVTLQNLSNACSIASEAPYRPSLINSTALGVHEMLFASLLKTDLELRRELASNIILTGGNTCMNNFSDRIQKELSILVPSLFKVKIINYPERMMAAWYGGAIIASAGTFQTMWITRSEYSEYGPSIVLRKCI